jgi:hypothetical protein
LIVIDEFQVLLGDQKKGDEAQSLLEDLIRRGRSFGIHVVLSSQSLADGLLSSPSKSNLAGRICLRLSERECHEFLSVENSLPSTFSEPGQAVYNDSEGLREGNLEFRVAYYPQDEVEKAVLQLRNHGVESDIQVSSPYIYRSDSALKRADLPKEFSRPGMILLGVEEGIPRNPVVASLAADSGPLLICGRKTVRNHLEAHFRAIEEQNPERFTWLEGEEVDKFVSDSVADPSFTPRNCDVVILTISDKNAQNYELSEVLGRIIKESRLKLIVLTDFPDTLNSLSFDQNRWEWLICTDRGSQESFAGFVEPDSTAGRNGLAAFFETGAMTPSLVRIPE